MCAGCCDTRYRIGIPGVGASACPGEHVAKTPATQLLFKNWTERSRPRHYYCLFFISTFLRVWCGFVRSPWFTPMSPRRVTIACEVFTRNANFDKTSLYTTGRHFTNLTPGVWTCRGNLGMPWLCCSRCLVVYTSPTRGVCLILRKRPARKGV